MHNFELTKYFIEKCYFQYLLLYKVLILFNMGYGLKRLLEIEEERKKRREEKERIKKEKEEEKKRLKKIEHKKKLKKKQNKRAYTKRRKAQLDERKKKGDEWGYFSIYITKDQKRVRFVGTSWWKTDAYKIYSDAIEKNRQKTKFPQNRYKYEILLVKKTNEDEDTVVSLRNEDGKFIDNVITDWENHVIVDKNDWFVEEKFGISGYHPKKQKKNYSFILNELLLNNEDVGDEMRRVMVFKNRVIIQYLDDFDFITCYDNDQAKVLYDTLQDDILKLKKKFIVFMGQAAPDTVSKWLDKFEEKTGMNRNSLKHKSTKG